MCLSNKGLRLAIMFENADETVSITGIYEDGIILNNGIKK